MKSESKIQQEIVMWFRNNHCLKHHDPPCAIFSIPNERSNRKEQMTMVATGLLAGASDLIVVVPDAVLFVEVKDATGMQSPKQRSFEKIVTALGFKYYLVRSLESFQEISEIKLLKIVAG